jgi:predicted GIY-YIG superfamily endonuclease
MKQYFVYIMTSNSGTLYTGVTNNLQRRVYQHKNKLIEGFTSKYDVNRLVYLRPSVMYEMPLPMKNGSRAGDGARNWR